MTIEAQEKPQDKTIGTGIRELPFSTIFKSARLESPESPGVQGWKFNPDTSNYEPVEDAAGSSR